MFSLNMRDGDSNVVFNTCIRYNEHSVKTIREVLVQKISTSQKPNKSSLFRISKVSKTWLK